MRVVTWTTTRRIVQDHSLVELPAHIRTRHGYQFLRLPDIMRINGRMCVSKRSMDKLRTHVAKSMQKRLDEMMRAAFLGRDYRDF